MKLMCFIVTALISASVIAQQEDVDYSAFDKDVLVAVAERQAARIAELEQRIAELEAGLSGDGAGEPAGATEEAEDEVASQTLPGLFVDFPEEIAPDEGGSWDLNPNEDAVSLWLEEHVIGHKLAYSVEEARAGFVVLPSEVTDNRDQPRTLTAEEFLLMGTPGMRFIPNNVVSQELQERVGRSVTPGFFMLIAGRDVQIMPVDIDVEYRSEAHIELDRSIRLGCPFVFEGTIENFSIHTTGESHYVQISLSIESVTLLEDEEPEILDSYRANFP